MTEISRDEIKSKYLGDYDTALNDTDNDGHPIVLDNHGVLRWKVLKPCRRNLKLFEKELGYNLNHMKITLQLLGLSGSKEEKEFYRNLGYSLSGYGDVFYGIPCNHRLFHSICQEFETQVRIMHPYYDCAEKIINNLFTQDLINDLGKNICPVIGCKQTICMHWGGVNHHVWLHLGNVLKIYRGVNKNIMTDDEHNVIESEKEYNKEDYDTSDDLAVDMASFLREKLYELYT